MEIEFIREFTLIAKSCNLTIASKELHVTQPVLSRHMKTLEAEIGLELFNRSVMPMQLTTAGEYFLEYACKVTDEWLRLLDFTKNWRNNSYETLRIQGLIDPVVLSFLRRLKMFLKDKFSHIKMRMPLCQSQILFDSLRENTLDIAIEPLSSLIDIHDLSYAHLVYEDSYIVMDADNEFASRDYLTVDDLSQMVFVSLHSNSNTAMRKHIQEICKQHGLLGDIPQYLEITPFDTYDELLLSGLDGKLLMLPNSLAEHYILFSEGACIMRPFGDESTRYDICAFYRKNTEPYIEMIIKHLMEMNIVTE